MDRANLGTPTRGPTLETMARHVDNSIGGAAAMSLYDRFYRPASTLTMHGGAAALMLHVTANGKLTPRRPAPGPGAPRPASPTAAWARSPPRWPSGRGPATRAPRSTPTSMANGP